MLQALLLRFGLTAIAPMVLPALGYLALGAGFGGFVWWNELADASTAILAGLSGGALLVMILMKDGWAKLVFGMLALLFGFLAGITYEKAQSEEERAVLISAHEVQIDKLHQGYAKKVTDEVARQVAANKEALAQAKEAEVEFNKERERLAELRIKLEQEAARDKDANRPAWGLDAVDRINSLRHDKKSVRPSGAKPKGATRGKAGS